MTRMRSLLLIALLAALVAVPSRAEEPGEPDDSSVREVFSGAGLLYSMPEVTVVYPAGPGEDRERNRISAERRAAFLRGRYETKTLVVADVDITEEHHDDNLLVLGWNNRVLAATGQVELSESGWNFLGIERGFSHDLLFAWVSPYDSSHQFAFWSRIDPELDRYLVLPFFGSDYVVFERYYAEQYGRFKREEIVWPPARNVEVMIDNRTRRPISTPRDSSEHYVLYDLIGLTDLEAAAILEAREEAWRVSTELLGSPEKPKKIQLYVYGDSDHKEVVSFVHDARHHLPADNELHLTKVIAMNPGPHEDSHLVARQLWGPGYLSVIVEGVAVWTEQNLGDNQLPVYAAMLTGREEPPSAADLLDEESMRVLVRNRVGFTYAGLFVSWLREAFGPEAVGRAYGVYDSDLEELSRVPDIPSGEIDGKFRDFVLAQAALGADEAAFRAAQGEGRHYKDLGDYERAVPAYERALEIKPDHLSTRYNLARLQKELDMLDSAEDNLRRILKAPQERRQGVLTSLTWFQLGDVLTERGDAGKAREAYEAVLELPDDREIHSRAQEALEALEADR